MIRKTNVKDVIKTLSKYYGKKIIIKDKKLNDYKLTATFEKQKLEEVLIVIEQTLDIKYHSQNNEIILNLNE